MTDTSFLTYRKPGRAYCVEATQWDFTQTPGRYGYHPQAYIHPDDQTDVVLTKPDIDYARLVDTSLFSVCGYITQAKADQSGIYLTDGVSIQKRCQSKHVGIISFEELDPNIRVEAYPLTPEEITVIHRQDGHYPQVYFHPRALDIKNHVVGLVVAGELYFLPQVENGLIKVTSPNTLKLNLEKWRLFQKAWRARKLFNDEYNRLGLMPYKDGRISTKEILSETFLKNLFTQPQTFLVVLRTEKPLTFEKKLLGHDMAPLRYFIAGNAQEDIGFAHEPLMFSDGRWMPYLHRDDHNGIVICCEDTIVYPQINDTLWRIDQPYLNESNISSREGYPRRAHFIKITSA